MNKSIFDGVTRTLWDTFGLPVYMEAVEQGAKLPAFLVTLVTGDYHRHLGRRFFASLTLSVTYVPEDGEDAIEACHAMMAPLYEALDVIETESGPFRLHESDWQVIDRSLVMTCEYQGLELKPEDNPLQMVMTHDIKTKS